MLFPAFYVYAAEFFSKHIKTRGWQIVVSFVVSIGIWFILAVPVIVSKFSSIVIGVVGYIIIIGLAHYLLNRRNYQKPISLSYTTSQKIGRAAFVGLIVFLVVFLGKTLNPFWGGLFSMFPAALSSSLMILHWYYNPKSLFPAVQRVPMGSISLIVYVLIAMIIFPTVGFIWGTLISYLASLATTLAVYKITVKPKESFQ